MIYLKFSEKLKASRKRAGFTQAALAEKTGVSIRTIIKYENGDCYPRTRDTYHKLAEILDTDVNFLLTEDERFILTASESYGSKGERDAKRLLEQAVALFAGGDLDDDDKLSFVHQIQELYLDSKEKAKKFASRR